MASDIMEGIKNQYLTYPFKVVRPFGKYVKGEIIKAKDVSERGDSFMLEFPDGASLKLSVIDKYLRIHDVNVNVGAPESLSGAPLIDKSKPEFAELELETNTQFPMRTQQQVNNIVEQKPVKPQESYFSKFNNDEYDLPLNIKIKLPDIAFLKAMYKNAANSKEFLNELSSYVQEGIKNEVITASLLVLLDEKKKLISNGKKTNSNNTVHTRRKVKVNNEHTDK